jgi:hypothetical protein
MEQGVSASTHLTHVDTTPLPETATAVPATGPRQRLFGSLTIQALLILGVTRLVLAGVSWFTLRVFPALPLYPEQLPDTFLPKHLWLDGWARWDAAHYVTIALHNYGGAGNLSHNGGLGFFPLYPMLMRWPLQILGIGLTEARLAVVSILLANLCFIVLVPLFAHLVARDFGAETARISVLLLCISPFSFFFSAGYSESLFLLLVILSFVFAERRWWIPAALCSALLTATRLVGLAMPPSLLLLAWRRKSSWRELLSIAILSPLGVVAFFGYTWAKFNDPLAYFHAQANWGGWSDHVWYWFKLFTLHPRETLTGDPRNLIIVLNVALALACLATLPWCWKRLNAGVALFTTLMVVDHLAMTWVSLGRYLLPAIGAYIAVAVLLQRPAWRGWPRDVLIVVSTLLLAMLTILFAHNFWVV